MWWLEPSIDVVLQTNATEADVGTVLIGLGDAATGDAMAGVVLNNKGMRSPSGQVWRSVSEYVLNASEATLRQWRSRLPHGSASIARIVLEDLSLDSCFALLLLHQRLSGDQALTADDPLWVAYVTDWEAGRYSDTELRRSVALLVTMLGHSYLASGDTPTARAAACRHGLPACLTLLHALARSAPNPQQAFAPSHLPEYQRALSQFDFEQQLYRLALSYGRQCQLLIPLRASNRKVLVDALILEEVEASGILKVLARTDLAHSYSGRGFAVLAIYRPSQSGSGNEMTISIDPTTGLTLEALWHELERRENLAWSGQRPRDQPRRIESYRLAQTDALAPTAPNEPWWDDGADYTLLGAPKQLTIAGQVTAGTRLRWREDVLSALWSQYQPIPGEAICAPLIAIADRQLAMVRWASSPNIAIAESPTFQAWLAALSMGVRIDSPLDLPVLESFEVDRLNGGLVVVHAQGLTVFDDWRSTTIDGDVVHTMANEVARASQQMRDFLSTKPGPIALALERQKQILDERSTVRWQTLKTWQQELLGRKVQMLEVLTLALGKSEPHELAQLRRKLARTWGLAEERDRMFTALEQIDRATSEAFEHLKLRRTALGNQLLAGAAGVYLFGEFWDKAPQAMRDMVAAAVQLVGKPFGDFEQPVLLLIGKIVLMAGGFVLAVSIYRRWGTVLGKK